MKLTRCAALLLVGSALSLSAPAFAQTPHPGGPPGGHTSPGFHTSGAPHFSFSHRDFGHFTPAEHDHWVGGRWNHGWHNGRYGWWWFAGGLWYFYDTPVYPYPGYVSDYYADDETYAPGPGYWYYCPNPPGYYPYVQSCSTPWQPVPPAPPPGYAAPQTGPSGPPPGPSNGPSQPPAGYQGPARPAPGDQSSPPPPGYPPPGQQPPGSDQGPGTQPPGDQNGPPPGYPPPGDQNAPPPGYPPPPSN